MRAELDLAIVEDEERRAREAAILARRKLVTWAIHVQLLPANKPFGMGQDNRTDRETSQAEFVSRKYLAGPTNGTPAMTHAELGGDDQNVALLRLGNKIQRMRRVSVNSQLRRRDLSLAVVVERPGRCDLGVNELDRLAILLSRIGHFGEVFLGQRVN